MKRRKIINTIILFTLLAFLVICLIVGAIFSSKIIALGLIVPLISFLVNILFYKSWYDATNHHYIENKAQLSITAEIVNVDRYIVGSKGDKRYRTIIEFSDGYTYVSHKSNIDNFILFKKVCISNELNDEIVEDALISHKKAVMKNQGKSMGLQ